MLETIPAHQPQYTLTMRAGVTVSQRGFRTARRFLSTGGHLSATASSAAQPQEPSLPVQWLDLRGSGLSILERLVLEECLLRHDSRHWLIVGTHEASRHRFLEVNPFPEYISKARQQGIEGVNTTTAVVLGLGGKPAELLNIPQVESEGCLCIKRFTGGGTVVLDHDSIWTTLLFRPPHGALPKEAYPRPIMEWSAERIFGPLFESMGKLNQQRSSSGGRIPGLIQPSRGRTLVPDTTSCGVDNTGKTLIVHRGDPKDDNSSVDTSEIPQFALRENDYVLGDLKMGGNAQSIVKNGWLHHTSFLWDYQSENMNLLTLPPKRPDYRKDRTHKDFLVKLSQAYPNLQKKDFMHQMQKVVANRFALQTSTLTDAMQVVNEQGGFQSWFDTKSRTRVLRELP